MLTKIALWATVVLLAAAIYSVGTWQFWCLIATHWAMFVLGQFSGAARALWQYMGLTDAEQREIKKIYDNSKGEGK